MAVRVAEMLRRGIPADKILALSFTNKAASELDERIGKIYRASLGRDEPEADLSKLTVSTFHSLGERTRSACLESSCWIELGGSLVVYTDRRPGYAREPFSTLVFSGSATMGGDSSVMMMRDPLLKLELRFMQERVTFSLVREPFLAVRGTEAVPLQFITP